MKFSELYFYILKKSAWLSKISSLLIALVTIFSLTEKPKTLPATFAYHLPQTHAFVDGNKRVAAVVSELFLKLNGAKLTATNDEIVKIFLDIAAGKLSREDVEEKFSAMNERNANRFI